MANKGIVVKVKDSYCIILSGDGSYKKIPRSRVKNPRVGAETEFTPVNRLPIKPLLMVACMLVFVLGLNIFRLAQENAAEAYVSLDINPSVELAVDKNVKVVEVSSLNEDAKKLIDDMDLEGKNLYAALRLIVNEAASEGYIKPNQKNYVLSTVTADSESRNLINYDNIAVNLQESVSDKGLDVEFVILAADMKLRNEAKSKGLSTGKMIVYQNSLESGQKITVSQVKENSLTKLVNTHQIKLVPANIKAFVKTIHVPPGQLKKGNFLLENETSGDIQEDQNSAENIHNKAQNQGKGQNRTTGDDLKDKSKDKYKDNREKYQRTDDQQSDKDSSETKKHSIYNGDTRGKTKIPKSTADEEIIPDDNGLTNETNITDENKNTHETQKEKKNAKSRN